MPKIYPKSLGHENINHDLSLRGWDRQCLDDSEQQDDSMNQ